MDSETDLAAVELSLSSSYYCCFAVLTTIIRVVFNIVGMERSAHS